MEENKQLDRIEAKIDKLDLRQNRMELTQVEQHLTLEEHTRRSTNLEKIVMPMKSDIDRVKGALQFIGLLGIFAGIGDVILRLLHR